MIVVCKMPQCPYWDRQGFCGKGVVKIDENGMCSVLWKHGQQRTIEGPITEERYRKHLMKIVDTEEYEQETETKTIETKEGEGGDGTNPEDPLNGAAATNDNG